MEYRCEHNGVQCTFYLDVVLDKEAQDMMVGIPVTVYKTGSHFGSPVCLNELTNIRAC